jgi:hypothetical protein
MLSNILLSFHAEPSVCVIMLYCKFVCSRIVNVGHTEHLWFSVLFDFGGLRELKG